MTFIRLLVSVRLDVVLLIGLHFRIIQADIICIWNTTDSDETFVKALLSILKLYRNAI